MAINGPAGMKNGLITNSLPNGNIKIALAGAPGAFLDRDYDGYLQSPDAEHAGRSRRGG